MMGPVLRDIVHLLWLGVVIAFPFVAMILMWRRMKKVRAQVYAEAETPRHEEPWQETVTEGEGLALNKTHSPNDELIGLGAREKQPPWTLTNQ